MDFLMTFHRGFHFVTCYMKYSQSVKLSVACNTFGLNSFLWGILEPIGFEKWTTPTARGTQLISGKTRNQSNINQLRQQPCASVQLSKEEVRHLVVYFT